MEFKFIGNPHDPTDSKGEVSFYGMRFPLNIPVKVENPKAIEKLMGNNHFAICGGDGKTHVQVKPAKLIVPKEAGLILPGAIAKPKRGRKSAQATA